MSDLVLEDKESFNLVKVMFELYWHEHVTTLVSSAAEKLGFLLLICAPSMSLK